MTIVKPCHVGDVIRRLRKERDLSLADVAQSAGINQREIADLERRGPDIEHMTPREWRALDRLAVTFGLRNGASLYKLMRDAPGQGSGRPSSPAPDRGPRVLSFGGRRSPRRS